MFVSQNLRFQVAGVRALEVLLIPNSKWVAPTIKHANEYFISELYLQPRSPDKRLNIHILVQAVCTQDITYPSPITSLSTILDPIWSLSEWNAWPQSPATWMNDVVSVAPCFYTKFAPSHVIVSTALTPTLFLESGRFKMTFELYCYNPPFVLPTSNTVRDRQVID